MKLSRAEVLETSTKLFAPMESFDSRPAGASRLYFSLLTPRQRGVARLSTEFWAASPRTSELNKMLNDQYNKLQAFLKSSIEDAIEEGELKKEIYLESLATIPLATPDGLESHWMILKGISIGKRSMTHSVTSF